MGNFRELEVWKDSCWFSKEVYGLTSTWRDFGLKDQLTRATVSIASNIAEGSKRGSDAEFVRFLRIAQASCAECRTQLMIAQLAGNIPSDQFSELDNLAETISKRLTSLIKYLKSTK